MAPGRRKRTVSISSSKASEAMADSSVLTSPNRRGRFSITQHMDNIRNTPISKTINPAPSKDNLPGDEAEMVDTINHDGDELGAGDFVLVQAEGESEPNPAHIFTCWTNEETKVEGLYICWYLLPLQTNPQKIKTCYEHEVFKSSRFTNILASDIIERCFVLAPKTAERGVPKACKEEHQVFICRNIFNEETKSLDPIKDHVRLWPHNLSIEQRKEMMKVVDFKGGPRPLVKVDIAFLRNPRAEVNEAANENEDEGDTSSMEPSTPKRQRSMSIEEAGAATTPRRRGRPRKHNLPSGVAPEVPPPMPPQTERPRRTAATYAPVAGNDQISQTMTRNQSQQQNGNLDGLVDGNSESKMQLDAALPVPPVEEKPVPPPLPPPQIAEAIVELFPKDSQGRILWFPTPPIVVDRDIRPKHSKAYIEWRKKQQLASL